MTGHINEREGTTIGKRLYQASYINKFYSQNRKPYDSRNINQIIIKYLNESKLTGTKNPLINSIKVSASS